MTDPDPAAHEHSLRVTFPKFGEVGLAADIIAETQERSRAYTRE